MKEVTFMLTACNRIDLLRKTMDSFLQLNTYPIKEYIAHNDGDDRLFNDIIKRYPQIQWYFSGQRIGYAKSLDFLLNKVKTEYIFSSEEDWSYYKNPGFIEKSLKILEENKDLNQVWIRDVEDHSHPCGPIRTVSGIQVRDVIPGFRKYWNGYSWNSSLRRMADIKKMFPNGIVEFADEIDQAKHSANFNYKAVTLVETSMCHLGWNRRSINFRA